MITAAMPLNVDTGSRRFTGPRPFSCKVCKSLLLRPSTHPPTPTPSLYSCRRNTYMFINGHTFCEAWVGCPFLCMHVLRLQICEVTRCNNGNKSVWKTIKRQSQTKYALWLAWGYMLDVLNIRKHKHLSLRWIKTLHLSSSQTTGSQVHIRTTSS